MDGEDKQWWNLLFSFSSKIKEQKKKSAKVDKGMESKAKFIQNV